MDAFADVQDVASIWRPLSDEESNLVAAWIDVASQQVRDEVPLVGGLTVDERLTAGSLAVQTVRFVVAQMVLRVMKNPEGARQRSQTVDDYQESITIDSARSSGEMTITESEMNRLMSVRGESGLAFSIDTAPTNVMFSKPWGYASQGNQSPWDWPYAWDQFPP